MIPGNSSHLSEIKNLRLWNLNTVIIGNVNINSLTNKFEHFKELVIKHIDVLVITKAKLDDLFPTSQFLMKGFAEPFSLDRNRNGGEVMIYISDDIPSRLLWNMLFKGHWRSIYRTYRSRHQRCSMKKVVLRNFTKFTIHLCQSLLFNKALDLQLY